MGKKFKLTDTTELWVGIKMRLYRIRALKDFGDVKAGELGGWVESEDNLDQEGNCWVEPDGCVYGKARIEMDAIVKPWAQIGNAAVIKSSQDYLFIPGMELTAYVGANNEVYIHYHGESYTYAKFPNSVAKEVVGRRFIKPEDELNKLELAVRKGITDIAEKLTGDKLVLALEYLHSLEEYEA